jgi:F-type H+-transporting ATPase subunit epsilon
MQLEIITPENKVFSGDVTAVQLPGTDGLFQVLNGHAPIISALKEGIVKVDVDKDFIATENTHKSITVSSNKKQIMVAINGGVIEMLNNKITVLAE